MSYTHAACIVIHHLPPSQSYLQLKREKWEGSSISSLKIYFSFTLKFHLSLTSLLLVVEYELYKHSILNLRETNDLIMSYTCFLAILYKWPTKEMTGNWKDNLIKQFIIVNTFNGLKAACCGLWLRLSKSFLLWILNFKATILHLKYFFHHWD